MRVIAAEDSRAETHLRPVSLLPVSLLRREFVGAAEDQRAGDRERLPARARGQRDRRNLDAQPPLRTVQIHRLLDLERLAAGGVLGVAARRCAGDGRRRHGAGGVAGPRAARCVGVLDVEADRRGQLRGRSREEAGHDSLAAVVAAAEREAIDRQPVLRGRRCVGRSGDRRRQRRLRLDASADVELFRKTHVRDSCFIALNSSRQDHKAPACVTSSPRDYPPYVTASSTNALSTWRIPKSLFRISRMTDSSRLTPDRRLPPASTYVAFSKISSSISPLSPMK